MRRAIAGAIALAVAGCGPGGSDGSVPPSTSHPAVAIDLAASGVGIIAEGCSLVAQLGSGVALGTVGQVVTAAHTIAGTSVITVVDRDGVEHAATVRAFDPDADLAVVDAPTLDAPTLTLAASSGVGAGWVVVWSRDEGVVARQVETIRRLSITIEDIYVKDTVVRSGIEISGDIEIGDSGAAVVDANGEVTGIVYASSRQRGRTAFATDAIEITGLLATITGNDVDNGRCL